VAILVATVCVLLGRWQLNRLAQRRARNGILAARLALPPLPVRRDITADSARQRRVVAQGVYDFSAERTWPGRSFQGTPGVALVTPLRLADGSTVLVDRGWVAQGASRAVLPEVPPPAGPIVVEGRINLPPARYLELGADPNVGPIRENLDIARIAASSGLPLLPFIVEQTQDTGDGLVRDWPAPDFGIEQHQSYMVQWYSLAALGVVLWLALNWRTEKGDGAASR